MTETPFDPKKAAAEAIEATSGVLASVKRQLQAVEIEMARAAQAHEDLTKIKGWVRLELEQQVKYKKLLEQKEADDANK